MKKGRRFVLRRPGRTLERWMIYRWPHCYVPDDDA
jgi:hypothetical protein